MLVVPCFDDDDVLLTEKAMKIMLITITRSVSCSSVEYPVVSLEMSCLDIGPQDVNEGWTGRI